MILRKASVDYSSSQPRKSAAYNIGEVLDILSHEFHGITASKIRFYEEKGLVTPQRTAAGYRQFTEVDIERLRFVLALQRDHFLPLKVIRQYLEAIDRGEGPEALPPGVSAALAPRAVEPAEVTEKLASMRRLTAEQLRTESGASRELFEAMLSYGLITSEEGKFDEYALRIARSCVALTSYGVEPRHLRPLRLSADRDFGLIEQAVASSLSRADGRTQAAETAREISGLLFATHAAMVQKRIATMEDT